MKPFRIFIGYDEREKIAFDVLAHSIHRLATFPVSITPLDRRHLGTMFVRPRGPLESTDFSISRFLVPYLCDYEGFALFMDCDMLARADVTQLMAYGVRDFIGNPSPKAVSVCQHDYQAKEGVKFLGQVQTAYPRKNWSSFMLFNNAECRALTNEYVNTASGLDLHRFNWLKDDQIGSLPIEWNWLIGEYADNPAAAKVLHWTLGGPWFWDTRAVDAADLWFEELARLRTCETSLVG